MDLICRHSKFLKTRFFFFFIDKFGCSDYSAYLYKIKNKINY